MFFQFMQITYNLSYLQIMIVPLSPRNSKYIYILGNILQLDIRMPYAVISTIWCLELNCTVHMRVEALKHTDCHLLYDGVSQSTGAPLEVDSLFHMAIQFRRIGSYQVLGHIRASIRASIKSILNMNPNR